MSGIRVAGLAALNKKMDRLAVEMERAAFDAMEEGAMMVADRAKQRAPSRSGELRDSITHSRGEEKGEWRAGTNLWRAHFTEFGTVNSAARPYLFPSFEELRNEIVQRITVAQLRGAIRGVAR